MAEEKDDAKKPADGKPAGSDGKEPPKPEPKPEVKSNILKSVDDYVIVYKFINAYKKAKEKKLFKPDEKGEVSLSSIITTIQKNYLDLGYSGEPSSTELQDAYKNSKTITGKENSECLEILSNDPSIIQSEYNKFKINQENNVEASRKNLKIAETEYKESAKINGRQKAIRNLGYIGKGVTALTCAGGVVSPALAVLLAVGGIAGLAATSSLGLVALGVGSTYAMYKIAKKVGGILQSKLDKVINKCKAIIKGDDKVKGSNKHKSSAKKLVKQNRKELYNYNAMANSYQAINAEAIKALEDGGELLNDSLYLNLDEIKTRVDAPADTLDESKDKENLKDDKELKVKTADPKLDVDKKLINGNDLWSDKADWKVEFENADQRKELILDSIYNTIGLPKLNKKDIKKGSDVNYNTLLNINNKATTLAGYLDDAYKLGKQPDGKTKNKIFEEIKNLEGYVKNYKDAKELSYEKSDYNNLISKIDENLTTQLQVNKDWQTLDNFKSDLKKVDGKQNKYITDDLVKKYLSKYVSDNMPTTQSLNEAIKEGVISDLGVLNTWNKLDLEKRDPKIAVTENFSELETNQILNIINQQRPDDFTKPAKGFNNNTFNINRTFNVLGKYGIDDAIKYKPIPDVKLTENVQYNANEILNNVNSNIDALVNKNLEDLKEVNNAKNTYRSIDKQLNEPKPLNTFNIKHPLEYLKNKFKNDRTYANNDISMFINENIIAKATTKFVAEQLGFTEDQLNKLPDDKKQEAIELINFGVKNISDFYNNNQKDITKQVQTQILIKNVEEKENILLSPEVVNNGIIKIIDDKLKANNNSWEDFNNNINKVNVDNFTMQAANICIKDAINQSNIAYLNGLQVVDVATNNKQITLEDAANKIYDFYTTKRPKDPFVSIPQIKLEQSSDSKLTEVKYNEFADTLLNNLDEYKLKADNKAKVQLQLAEAIKHGETTYGNIFAKPLNAISSKISGKENISNYVAGILSSLSITNPNNDAYTFNKTKDGEAAHLCALFEIKQNSTISDVQKTDIFNKVIEYLGGKVKNSSEQYLPFDYSKSKIKGKKYEELNLEALVLDIGDNALNYGNWLKNITTKQYNGEIIAKLDKKIKKFEKRKDNPSLFDKLQGISFKIKNYMLDRDASSRLNKEQIKEANRKSKIEKLINKHQDLKIANQKAYEPNSLELY